MSASKRHSVWWFAVWCAIFAIPAMVRLFDVPWGSTEFFIRVGVIIVDVVFFTALWCLVESRQARFARVQRGHCPVCDHDRGGVFTNGPCSGCGRRLFPACGKCGRDMTGIEDRACPDCGVMYGIEWPEELDAAPKPANPQGNAPTR